MIIKQLATKASLLLMTVLFIGAAASMYTEASNIRLSDDVANLAIPEPLVTEDPSTFDSYVDTSSGRPILYTPNSANATWYHLWIGAADYSSVLFWDWVEKDAALCDATTCAIIPNAHPVNGEYRLWMQTWAPSGWNNDDPNFWTDVGVFTVSLSAPGVASNITVNVNGSVVNGTWLFVPHATWYNIWIGRADFTGTNHYDWHSALDLGCNGSGNCSLTLTNLELQPGVQYIWYVKGWGPGGPGEGGPEDGWAHSSTFTP